MARIATLAIAILLVSSVSHATPAVFVIPTAPFDRVPEAPSDASPQLRALFEGAADIRRFEQALGRYYRRLVGDQHTARREQLSKSSGRGLTVSMISLGTEILRQVGLARDTKRAELLHLQAWTEFQIAEMVYEAGLEELDASLSLLPETAIEVAPNYSSAMAALREVTENFPNYRARDTARIQYAHLLLQTGNEALSKETALSVVCPEGLGATPNLYATPNPYETCENSSLSPDIASYVWMFLIGQQHFETANELPLAASAYQKALASGGQHAPFAAYLLGWSYYRQDLYDPAIASFLTVLDTESADHDLQNEAVTYIALSVLDQWEAQRPRRPLLEAAATRFAGHFNKDHVKAIFVELLRTAETMQLRSDALSLASFIDQTWP